MQYEMYRDGFATTGDLFFFSDRGIGPWLIQIGQRFAGQKGWRWNHVGMVVRQPSIDAVYLFEAVDQGVQVSFLSQRVLRARDDGSWVRVRRLKRPLNATKTMLFAQARRKFIGTPYEENYLDLIESAFRTRRKGSKSTTKAKEALKSVFCSELIAVVLQKWGWLNSEIRPDSYCPAELYTAGLFGHYVVRGESIE